MSTPLRVGVIGCGGIAQMMHLPAIAERPDLFTLVALADVASDTLEAVGARYKVSALHRDPAALISRADVDAVLLSSSGDHRALALQALSSKKHLFVEKPLAYSLKETEEIASAAAKSGVKLMIGYHKRFDPAVRRAKQLIGAMRDPRYAEVTVLHPDDAEYRRHHVILPLRSSVAPAPAPQLSAHAVAEKLLCESLIHDLNLMRGFLGEPEAVISAEVWRDGMAQHSLSRFAGDLRASISWIYLPGLKHYEERLTFVAPERRVQLVFPSPYLKHFPTTLRVEHMDGEARVTEDLECGFEEAFRLELHSFRRSVVEGAPLECGPEEALGDMRWIQAIAARYGHS